MPPTRMSSYALFSATSLWLAAAVNGCSSATQTEGAARSRGERTLRSGAQAHEADPSEGPGVSVTLVTDANALAVVARAGGGFDKLVGQGWDSIAPVLRGDISAIARADNQAGVEIRGNAHRLFDARWLALTDTEFELIAVVNRLDRMPFTPDRCGESRLIYRLAYSRQVAGQVVRSRLPMTLVVAMAGSASTSVECGQVARRWQAPRDLSGEKLGTWLVGPAGPLSLEPRGVSRIEINMQSVRWPSAVRPDLGGHAEYIMRVFSVREDRAGFDIAPLMNTPDVTRLRGRDKERLLSWIRRNENLQAIDAGTAQVPDEFLATRAVSVTPRGLSRRANRPYRQLFSAEDFAELELSHLNLVRSPEALLRRLDDLTCQGCHQSRTIAGFHLLGDDGDDVAAGNALAVSSSVHLLAERSRRAAITTALTAGETPSFARPFAERVPGQPGRYGDHCGLGDPGFASWTCASGLRCDAYDAPKDDAIVGMCVPVAPEVGDACQIAALTPAPNPHQDRASHARSVACASGAVCNSNRVGFPGGMCTENCASLSPAGTCGAIALLTPFNNCLARRQPFPKCLTEHVAPAGLRACDAETPCRDDYICASSPTRVGACIPPYFLFQLRVDGH